MSGTQTKKVVEIHPKTAFLSPTELIKHRHAEIELPRSGLKRTHNEGSPNELAELEIAYANLRSQLSVPRIERLAGRGLATYHPDQQVVEVLRKDGKFENFGYNNKGKLYLEYYEALFLVEVNRLQLEYEGMILSIEQTYNLLLGPDACDKYNHYLVYSGLSRLGYIVVRHQRPEVSRDDCIWAVLEEKITRMPIKENIKNSIIFQDLQNQMEASTRRIISQDIESNYDTIDFKYILSKRKLCEQDSPVCSTSNKRACLTSNHSLVDILKNDSNFIKFQEIFKKFDIVKLDKSPPITTNFDDQTQLNITFDLHLPNEGFRKSCLNSIPSFNVVVLPVNSSFPIHNDIARLQCKVPLLIISVSESKQIQAFLYYIS